MLDMEMKLDDQKRPLLGFGNKAFNSDEITSVWRSLSKSSVIPILEHPNHWNLFLLVAKQPTLLGTFDPLATGVDWICLA